MEIGATARWISRAPACSMPWTMMVYQKLMLKLNVGGIFHTRFPEKGNTGGGVHP